MSTNQMNCVTFDPDSDLLLLVACVLPGTEEPKPVSSKGGVHADAVANDNDGMHVLLTRLMSIQGDVE